MKSRIGLDKVNIIDALSILQAKDIHSIMTRAKFSEYLRNLLPSNKKGIEETNQHNVNCV